RCCSRSCSITRARRGVRACRCMHCPRGRRCTKMPALTMSRGRWCWRWKLRLPILSGYTWVMTTDQLRNLWKAHPFKAFTIHLADGRSIPVQHQEFLMLSPSGRTMIVYQPDESFNVIDLLLVTDLAVGSNGKSGGRRKNGR